MIIKETVFNSNRNHILTQEQSKVHKKILKIFKKKPIDNKNGEICY